MSFSAVTEKAAINQALYKVTHGLYILTSRGDSRINGQCLDALMQVTNMPPRIAIGVGKRSLTHEMIAGCGLFVVNVLNEEDPKWREKIKHYGFQSGRKVEKFTNDVKYSLGNFEIPILNDALAFYECRVEGNKTLDLATHTLFVGLVERAGTQDAGKPLTYNYYREVMKKGG
jgi:flavin reductase (DIM6/NTAB) family NADH-FMN oxidoreductase RutF